jgi:peptide/nickel transport system substrate-binding protein
LTFKKPAFTDGPSYLGKTFIVPEHIWKNKTDFATDINSNPIGTGPMKFSSFTPESYLLVKNANYRGASTMAVKGVRVMSLSGNQAATNELLAGQLDWSGIFIPNVTQVLKAAPAVSLSATGNQQIVLHTCSNVQLGCTGPQTDTVVRHAIALAMDRTQINKLAYFGRGSAISPTYGIIGRDNKFISSAYPAESMTPNITAADSLLAADGWVKGSDGIYAKNGTRLSMNAVVTSGYTDYIAVLSVLTQQLKAAGIEITTSQAANAEVISDQTLGKFQIAIGSVLQGPVGDPYYLYDSNYSSVGVTAVGKVGNPYGDLTKFVNPAVNAALTKAASTTNIATKTAAYATIQSAIVADMPDIPVLNNTNFAEFSSANYTGWPTFQNQYASADPGAGPSNEVVLAHLTAK